MSPKTKCESPAIPATIHPCPVKSDAVDEIIRKLKKKEAKK